MRPKCRCPAIIRAGHFCRLFPPVIPWLLGLVIISPGVADSSKAVDRELPPLPRQVPEPKHNRFSPQKVALGKQLFFEPRLSGDNSMSCATCHLPERAWADGRRRSLGNQGRKLKRNTPSLHEVARTAPYMHDGSEETLFDVVEFYFRRVPSSGPNDLPLDD